MPFLPFAQLAVTVTTTPEFCAGDGDVAINVTGTKVGASFDFEIYNRLKKEENKGKKKSMP